MEHVLSPINEPVAVALRSIEAVQAPRERMREAIQAALNGDGTGPWGQAAASAAEAITTAICKNTTDIHTPVIRQILRQHGFWRTSRMDDVRSAIASVTITPFPYSK